MTSPNRLRLLDRIDLAILDVLQKNGRISNVNLAKQVNLSASPCLDRVKRLDDSLANALEINESHQRYNGKLQVRVTELEGDNKKLSQQISDYIRKHEDRFRKSGL